MGVNQSDLQQSIRDQTGTDLTYEGDWHALFDEEGIAAGTFNNRLHAYLNAQLGVTYDDLPSAMQAYAVSLGFYNWSSMNTALPAGAILAEDGSDMEDELGVLLVQG